MFSAPFVSSYIDYSGTEAASRSRNASSSCRCSCTNFANRYLWSSWLIIVVITTAVLITVTSEITTNTTSFLGDSAAGSYDELVFNETRSLIDALRSADDNNFRHVSDGASAGEHIQQFIFNDSSKTSKLNFSLHLRVKQDNLVSSRNFAAYPSTSTRAVELSVLQNVTGVSQSASRGEFIPAFEMVLGAVTYMVIIAMTVIGNILVVVAVFSYRPLKKVQNYFLVSLAASDLAVAVIVMPLHVVKFLADGRWLMGVTLCQVFTTFDILLCTSSIWNLCAIAIDRYLAIHDPIDYAQKRTPKFVCTVIAVVWLVSVMISVPPIIGWNDWSSQKLMDHCELTTEKAFVVYSASGSFFVPLCVMIVVYVKIFLSARQRIRTNRGRSALLKIGTQQNSSPGISDCMAPRFARLTPLVAATTTSVAHLLQRSSKSKNKNVEATTPPIKNKRSMSHASGATFMNGRLSTRRPQFFNTRPDRSNSSSGALAAVSAPAVSHFIAMAQRHNGSTSSSNNTLNGSAKSVNNNYSITQQTSLDKNVNERKTLDENEKLTDEKRLYRSKSVNKVDNKNNNLLFVITTDVPSTFTVGLYFFKKI